MIMYHGTIKEYADSILVNGLKPMPDNSFHVNHIPSPKGIYLTPDKILAESFAWHRSRYSQAQPGEEFDWWMAKNELGQPKLLDIDTNPVILKVEIPEDIKLEADPDFIGLAKAYRCDCSIPPDRVIEVIPMEDNV